MFMSAKYLLIVAFWVSVLATPVFVKPAALYNSTSLRHPATRADIEQFSEIEQPKYTLDSIGDDIRTVENAYRNAENIVRPLLITSTSETETQAIGESLMNLYLEGDRAKFSIKEHVTSLAEPTTQTEVDFLTVDIQTVLTLAKKVLGLITDIEKYQPTYYTLIHKHDGKAKVMIQYRVMFFQLSKFAKPVVKSDTFTYDQVKELQEAIENGWKFFTLSSRKYGPW